MSTRPHQAFTLVELIVTIAIIAVLIGILLPTLGGARESMRRVQCLSNQRQMGIAAAVYHQSYDGYFPPAYAAPMGNVTWELQLVGGVFRPGLLWDGDGTAEIQQCPSFRGPDFWNGSPYSGYNYNTSYLGHGYLEINPDPARIEQVRDPVNCAAFGDGHYADGANKFMRAPFSDAKFGDGQSTITRSAGAQGFRRHRDVTNAVFVDGHGRSLQTRYDAGNPHLGPGVGFLSPDNSLYDLQ